MIYTGYCRLSDFILEIRADESALLSIRRVEKGGVECENDLILQAKRELSEYAAGTRQTFSLPLRPAGTGFQQSVWRALLSVPYGETCCYADIAALIGKPAAVRAAAQAIGRNPLLIVIPCHRVIGKDGSLTGFAAGLDMKRYLLALERQCSGQDAASL